LFSYLKDIKYDAGFIFNSFNSDNNYFISDLNDCNLSDFECFSNHTPPTALNKNEYLNICSNLIDKLKSEQFKKVVLSRVEKFDLNKRPIDIFKQLNDKYLNTFNYIISIENVGCWLGATPEILAEFNNGAFNTVALAGTKSSKDDTWSNKELEEQQYVTDYIYNQLHPKIDNLHQSPTKTIKAGEVYHLKTEFNANLQTQNIWTDILKALHPTPATCGLPKKASQQLINQIEPHQRLFYTGFLGIISSNYKLLMVNLRCMQIIDNKAYLYLGGGITSSSIPQKEWEETQNKAKTLLNIIQ